LDLLKFKANYQLFLDFYETDDNSNFDFINFPTLKNEKQKKGNNFRN